jgi:hypothetical protein
MDQEEDAKEENTITESRCQDMTLKEEIARIGNMTDEEKV